MIKFVLATILTLFLSVEIAADDSEPSDNVTECKALFIENNEINIELFRIEGTRTMYFKMAEVLSIRVEIMVIDGIIANGIGDNEEALRLTNMVVQNTKDIQDLSKKYDDLLIKESEFNVKKNEIAKRSAEESCENVIIDISTIGSVCIVYPDRLKDTVACKEYEYLQNQKGKKINGPDNETRL